MDELIDFEELIDLNLSLFSVSPSAHESITEVLDKMCEATDESNLAIDNAFKDEIAPDDDIVNLDEFENLLSLCNDESNLVTDDSLEINDNDMVQKPDGDTLDLNELESISAYACLFIDDEDAIDNDNNDISNLQRDLSYEVPVEFEENVPVHKTVIEEENITSANNYVLQTISVESPAISNEKEIDNYTDLEAFEFGTVNPVSNKLKTVNKEYENGLTTVTVELVKNETNITENIVTLTTHNNSEVKNDNAIETSKTDCKNTIETVTEDKNSDSDDNFDPLDFEIISEQEACQAGIVTRVRKVTINETKATTNSTAPSAPKNAKHKLQTHIQHSNSDSDDNFDPLDFEIITEQEACQAGIVVRISKTINKTNATVTNSTQSTSKNADNQLQTHVQQNCTGQSTSKSNVDNRPRKNEASLSDYLKYSKYQRCYCSARPPSELHVIPEGERYLDMFRGEYAPGVVNNLYSLSNKRVLSAVAMEATHEELACRDAGVEEENEKYKDKADDCLKKILSAYPRENRRKRRRH